MTAASRRTREGREPLAQTGPAEAFVPPLEDREADPWAFWQACMHGTGVGWTEDRIEAGYWSRKTRSGVVAVLIDWTRDEEGNDTLLVIEDGAPVGDNRAQELWASGLTPISPAAYRARLEGDGWEAQAIRQELPRGARALARHAALLADIALAEDDPLRDEREADRLHALRRVAKRADEKRKAAGQPYADEKARAEAPWKAAKEAADEAVETAKAALKPMMEARGLTQLKGQNKTITLRETTHAVVTEPEIALAYLAATEPETFAAVVRARVAKAKAGETIPGTTTETRRSVA